EAERPRPRGRCDARVPGDRAAAALVLEIDGQRFDVPDARVVVAIDDDGRVLEADLTQISARVLAPARPPRGLREHLDQIDSPGDPIRRGGCRRALARGIPWLGRLRSAWRLARELAPDWTCGRAWPLDPLQRATLRGCGLGARLLRREADRQF